MRQWKLSVILDTSSMMTFYFAVSIKMSEGGSERKKCWMFSFTGEWNTNSWTAFANFLTENEAKSSMPAFPKFSIIHSSAILKNRALGLQNGANALFTNWKSLPVVTNLITEFGTRSCKKSWKLGPDGWFIKIKQIFVTFRCCGSSLMLMGCFSFL